MMSLMCTVQLWLLSGTLVSLASAKQGCLSSGLLDKRNPTPPLPIGDGITLRLKLQNVVKRLILHAILENDDGQELYDIGMTENMEVAWGDMEVTLKDSKTQSNVFKVHWPAILIPKAWTTLYLRLHYHHLLQLAIIPHEALEKSRNFVYSQILLSPTAISSNIERFGVTKLSLKLHTSNISIEYTVNCGQEFFATAFASEFGILSKVPFWRNFAWITLGIMVIFMVVLILTFLKMYFDRKKQKPNSFTLAKFQSGSKGSAASGPVMTSHTQGKRQKDSGGTEDEGTLQPPRVTVGVVSSRAPSPGQEVDENTMDYVNKAFSFEDN